MSFKSSFTIPAVAAISFCLIGGTTPAYADLGDQLFKLLASDGAASDQLSRSIAIDNGVVAVGSIFDDDNGTNSGSAYLFDAGSKTPCPWDLDKSGFVGTSDLLALFAQWGTDGSADFDESGALGTADLLILLANWGPCPK